MRTWQRFLSVLMALFLVLMPALHQSGIEGGSGTALAAKKATPTPTAGKKSSLKLSIQGAKKSGGVYKVYVSKKSDTFRIKWSSNIADAQYTLTIGSEESISMGTKTYKDLKAGKYMDDTYKVTVTAKNSKGQKASTSIRFSVWFGEAPTETPAPEVTPTPTPKPGTTDEPTPTDEPRPTATPKPSKDPSPTATPAPSEQPGPRPNPGRRSGGGGNTEEEQGFHVTPGTALTSSHCDGDGSMRLFGAVSSEPAEGEMTILTMGDDSLDITLDDNASFRAAVDGNRLILTPVREGKRWNLSQNALHTLNKSGISDVVLLTLDGMTEVETDYEMSGRIYGKLRSQGLVSSDFLLQVTAAAQQVLVDGVNYRIETDEHILKEAE